MLDPGGGRGELPPAAPGAPDGLEGAPPAAPGAPDGFEGAPELEPGGGEELAGAELVGEELPEDPEAGAAGFEDDEEVGFAATVVDDDAVSLEQPVKPRKSDAKTTPKPKERFITDLGLPGKCHETIVGMEKS